MKSCPTLLLRLTALLVVLAAVVLPSVVRATDDRIPGSMFTQDSKQAAIQSAPFWFFGRSLNREPCYPEDAAPNGTPNAGTPVSLLPIPGQGCARPGDWSGTYSKGNPFPTYWAVKYCPGDNSWRINYNLYFSHDGMGSIGHRHDWEWVAAIWKRCDDANDMWCRDRLLRSFHRAPQSNSWTDIQNTINDATEIRNLGDKNKHHPLIYVGAFKHAMFHTRKTSVNVLGADEHEFRSNDWWYFAGDSLVEGSVISKTFDYEGATSTPLNVMDGNAVEMLLVTSPGQRCARPGEWKGTYSMGNPFPTHWAVTHCPGENSWRINYNLYFSHNGMLSAGHRHDWKWVAAIWKRCDDANDMWCRNHLLRSFHRKPQSNNWGDIQNTINDVAEFRHLGDKNRHHPLIYVGAFKHAMFHTRLTSLNTMGADEHKFRSNDWWYFAGDSLVEGNVIDKTFNYVDATSTPSDVMGRICDL